jgi:hypothetical protein
MKGQIMVLKVYGFARSRAFRTLWMATGLELDYEHVSPPATPAPPRISRSIRTGMFRSSTMTG